MLLKKILKYMLNSDVIENYLLVFEF